MNDNIHNAGSFLAEDKDGRIQEASEILHALMNEANTYVSNAKAKNTVRSYQSDWRHFTSWCDNFGLPSLPTTEETYALYLTSLAKDGYKASTIQRRISAITQAHTAAGYESPTSNKIRLVWAGIKRTIGTEEKGKDPIILDTLKQILDVLPDRLLGIRDRALLLLGFAGAFRRSELVGIDVEDIKPVKEGIVISLKTSKTNQEGKKEVVAIPYGVNPDTCPVHATNKWLEAANISEGAVFRSINRHGQVSEKRLSDKAVAIIVKRYIDAVGLNEEDYSGHSLRSGFATTAAILGKSERSIMKQSRHKSDYMVRKYIRHTSLFEENAANDIGL
ncbi:hypothetical protein J45TS6_35220 [Paenibacillus sp. J45TS6]|uniref:site-specific integrase n=1 Tax=Paenibacillus sp. J45TS6 TaxID=2807196 RepID=UPI001B168083|nr:site-specific integrase [Paenibacillus sp. J45TS6]GIP45063.1 hypothetical protein J45TS6_35220 [Paenibacillus sp. J45TS6]